VKGDIRLLVVDDDAAIRRTFVDLVGSRPGVSVETAADGQEGLERVRRVPLDVAIVDLNMPVLGGMEFLEKARRARPDLSVVVLTGHGSIETAVEAMKLGASDYLTKPFKLSQIQIVLERLRMVRSLEAENRRLRQELGERYRVEGLVGRSAAMEKVHALVDRVRFEDCNVIIRGESGTGKELVARAIHYEGGRREGPFVTVDCGSVHASLLESELFGHLKGAFTGAVEDKVGFFERASGGTLFLDEVGELPAELQPAFLRALQEKRVRPVGGTEYIHADVRVIAATGRDLEEEVAEDRFRGDLFYRLNVVRIDLPPLRERKDDIPPLVQNCLRRHGDRRITQGAVHFLLRHDWPGNVRELENVLECACALSERKEIREQDLPPLDRGPVEPGGGRSLRDLEVDEIRRLLDQHGGDTGAVASVLGIDRSTLYRKLKRYRIELREFRSQG
jgi:DNA-binding NtrC family response regulator